MELWILSLASLAAGFVDAVVGGGGLLLVPALFTLFPNASAATLFGTNKAASVWGTAAAGVQYARRVRLRWQVLLPAAALAFGGALIGAWAVTCVDGSALRLALPFLLLALLIYTLARKQLGQHHAPRFEGMREAAAASAIGLVIGVYDGFFGPGTGSFFVFLFVRWLGYDFLNASACAKLMNTMTNLGALLLFGLKGHVWWHYALAMALANVAGGVLGARVALRYGAGFVRIFFMVVVSVLILKTGWDAFLR